MFKDSSLSVANFPRFSANKIVGGDNQLKEVRAARGVNGLDHRPESKLT